LFHIKLIDVADDVSHAIQLIKDRASRNCCKKRYLLIICNYHTEDAKDIVDNVMLLTKMRLQNIGDGDDASNANTLRSVIMNMNELQQIETKVYGCAVVAAVNNEQIAFMKPPLQLQRPVDDASVRSKMLREMKGFTQLVHKPISVDQLSLLISKYVS